jgi:hypothetical protein
MEKWKVPLKKKTKKEIVDLKANLDSKGRSPIK